MLENQAHLHPVCNFTHTNLSEAQYRPSSTCPRRLYTFHQQEGSRKITSDIRVLIVDVSEELLFLFSFSSGVRRKEKEIRPVPLLLRDSVTISKLEKKDTRHSSDVIQAHLPQARITCRLSSLCYTTSTYSFSLYICHCH